MVEKKHINNETVDTTEKLITKSLFLDFSQKEWVLSEVKKMNRKEKEDLLKIFRDNQENGELFLKQIKKLDPQFLEKFKKYRKKVEQKFYTKLEDTEKKQGKVESLLEELD